MMINPRNSVCRLFSAVLFALPSGCGRPLQPIGEDPPRVIGVNPDQVIDFGESVTVQFSAAMDQASLLRPGDPSASDTVVLVEKSHAAELMTALERQQLSARTRSLVLASTVEIAPAGNSLSLTPISPLYGNRDYVLLVGRHVRDARSRELVDERGNPATYQHVLLGKMPVPRRPPLLRFPPAGARQVPSNLHAILVDDNSGNVSLLGDDGSIFFTREEPSGARTILAPIHDGCTPLCPATRYTLLAGNQQPSDDDFFSTARCTSAQSTSFATDTAVVARDTGARITWKQSSPGVVRVESAASDPSGLARACLEQSSGDRCLTSDVSIVNCEPDVCSRNSDFNIACLGSITISDLRPSTDYSFRIVSEDYCGPPAISNPTVFRTLDQLPAVAITAVLNHSLAPDESSGEFIQVHVSGSETVDLCGLTLSLNGGGAHVLCGTAGPALLGPGKNAFVVGAAFDPATSPSIGDDLIIRAATGRLFGRGLPDQPEPRLTLATKTGVAISSYSGFGSCNPGVPIVRASAQSPDVATSWSCGDLNAQGE